MNAAASGPQVRVVCAFPGTGKSTMEKNLVSKIPSLMDVDLDSKFEDENFPDNYITQIQNLLCAGKSVLVSTHYKIRRQLWASKIPFFLVYPHRSCKQEYLQRYHTRGNDQTFIDKMDKVWSKWLQELEAQRDVQHVVLNAGEHLSDAVTVDLRSGRFSLL